MRGFNPDESLIEIGPREGEDTIRTQDILDVRDFFIFYVMF